MMPTPPPDSNSASALDAEMPHATTVIVAIFNRFGDGVIAAASTAAFIARWSERPRRFLLVTSPQLSPYVRAICPGAEVLAFSKRNPLHWLRLWLRKRFVYRGFDVGLNPYSYGRESHRIARLAHWHSLYVSPADAFAINYYDRVRQYLQLPAEGDFNAPCALPKRVERILLCPDSSETRRSLSDAQLESIHTQLLTRWPAATITLASGLSTSRLAGVRQLRLAKSRKASNAFLRALRDADLLVAVDSGPLHIAMALGIPSLALFSSAHPATVLDPRARVYPLRADVLTNVYCEKLDCREPICMNALNLDTAWQPGAPAAERTVVSDRCPYSAAAAPRQARTA